MSQFELLDQVLENSGYHGKKSRGTMGESGGVSKSYFAVLDSIVESALKESLTGAILKSSSNKNEVIEKLMVVNESVFDEDVLFSFMENTLTPLLEVSGMSEFNSVKKTAIASLPLYEAHLAAKLTEDEDEFAQYVRAIAESYRMTKSEYRAFVNDINEMLTDGDIHYVVCDVNELVESFHVMNEIGVGSPVLESNSIVDKLVYMAQIREFNSTLEDEGISIIREDEAAADGETKRNFLKRVWDWTKGKYTSGRDRLSRSRLGGWVGSNKKKSAVAAGAALAGLGAGAYIYRKKKKQKAQQESAIFLECMGSGYPGYDRLIRALIN